MPTFPKLNSETYSVFERAEISASVNRNKSLPMFELGCRRIASCNSALAPALPQQSAGVQYLQKASVVSLRKSPQEVIRTAGVCAHLRGSSNEVWSNFVASYGGYGLIAMGDCEECRRVYCECGAGVTVKGTSDGPYCVRFIICFLICLLLLPIQ